MDNTVLTQSGEGERDRRDSSWGHAAAHLPYRARAVNGTVGNITVAGSAKSLAV